MKVSIIVVTNNEKDTIQKKLASYIKQTKQADEIILVDNGSSDHTLEVAERFLHKQKISFKMKHVDYQSFRDCFIMGCEMSSGNYYILGHNEVKVDYIEKIIDMNKSVVVQGKQNPYLALQLMNERYVNESLVAISKDITLTETERMVIRYSLTDELGFIGQNDSTIPVVDVNERYSELLETFTSMKELGLNVSEYEEQLAYYAATKGNNSSFGSRLKALSNGDYKKYGNGLKDFFGDLF